MSTAEFYIEQGIDPSDQHSMNMWMQANNHHQPHHPLAYQPVGGGPHFQPHRHPHPHHFMNGMPMMMGPPPPMMMAPTYSSNNHLHPSQQQQRDPAVAMPPLNENELDGIAYSFGWTKLETPPLPPMASYRREQRDGAMSRLTFWLNNSTVGSFVDHPNNDNSNNNVTTANNNSNQHKKGIQLFRRNNISMPEAYAVLENPRLHAGQPRGFQNYQQQRYQQHQNQQQQQHHQPPNPNSQQQQPQPPLKHPRQRRPCRYGLHCHSAICKFQHPPGFVAPLQQQQQQQERSYPTKPKRLGGSGGGGGGRGPCRYGARCSRPDCWFQHPTMMNNNATCSTATTSSTCTESTKKENSTNSSVTSVDAVEEKKDLEV
jgi:hypothetical protein